MLKNSKENNPTFKGIGSVEVHYHKLTENTSKQIMNKVKNKLKPLLEKTLCEDLKNKIDYNDLSFKFIKTKAIELNLVDNEGNITFLRPKTVIIKDGSNVIPDAFDADRIVQRGGIINESLKGDKIFVYGGKNKGIDANIKYTQVFDSQIEGDIKTSTLITANTKLKNNTAAENAFLKGGTEIHGTVNVTKVLKTFDKTKLMENSAVRAEYASLKGETEVQGKLYVPTLLQTLDNTKFMEKSVINTYRAELSDKTKVYGKINAENMKIYGDAKLMQTSNVQTKNATIDFDAEVYGKLNVTENLKLDWKSKLMKTSDVNAKNAYLRCTSKVHGKLNVADNLEMYSGKLLKTSEVNTKTASLVNDAEVHGKLNVEEELNMFNDAKLTDTAKVKARSASLADKTRVNGDLNVKEDLTLKNNARLNQWSKTSATKVHLNDSVNVSGYLAGNIAKIDKDVKIDRTATLAKETFNSLPIGRKISYTAKHPMRVFARKSNGSSMTI